MQLLCDLSDGVSFLMPHQQHIARLRRHFTERFMQTGFLRCSLITRLPKAPECLLVLFAPSERLPTLIDEDLRQPGFKGAFPPELRQMLPSQKYGALHRILAFIRRQHAPGDGHQLSLAAQYAGFKFLTIHFSVTSWLLLYR